MEAGSVTGAAERLQRSQPAISKHLGLMEDAIGVRLFNRTGNRLVPTEEARRLFDQVERTYTGMHHLARFAESLRHEFAREVTIAAMPLLARAWLPDAVTEFARGHPKVSLSLPVRSSRWIAESVASGLSDIGLGLSPGEQPGVIQQVIMRLPLVCVLPRGHRLCALDVVVPADLDGETLISLSNFDHWRLTVEQALDASDARPARRIDTFTTYVACELVSRDAGVAIVDSLTAHDYTGDAIAWRPIEPALQFEICLMWSRHRHISPLIRSLIDDLKARAEATETLLATWLRA